MKIKNTQTNVTIIAISVIIFIGIVTSILTIKNHLDYSQMIATMGLLFAIAAFSGVLLNLNATYIQLRKSMAKPNIKVAFTENGEQQKILTFKDNTLEPPTLGSLWLINNGNTVAGYFQIDFIIPEKIGKPGAFWISFVSMDKKNGEYVLSYTNEKRYTLFVNRPYTDQFLVLPSAIDIKKAFEIYKDGFKIAYKIYGDWGEPQSGELKVILKKQELPNATTG